jgi:branched-subunit amino acid transport protein
MGGEMEDTKVILAIGGMVLVTAASRVVPAIAFGEKSLSGAAQTWLKYIPVSLIAALLLPEIFLKNDSIDLSLQNLAFWISIPTSLVAVRTRNIALTVIFGCTLIAATRLVLR